MSEQWVAMAFVWIVAELVGYFRKNNFSQRMKTAAKWSVALGSLSLYGGMSADKTSIIYFFSAVLFCTVFALPIYFYRLNIFNFVKNQFYRDSEIDQVLKTEVRKTTAFQLTNGITQLIAVIAGFYTGTLIYSLALAAIMLANHSVSGQ